MLVSTGHSAWLTCGPPSGSLDAGASTDIVLNISSQAAGYGEHQGTICIGTTDPAQPVRRIPVTLTVSGSAPPAVLDQTISVDVNRPQAVLLGPGTAGDDVLQYRIVQHPLHGVLAAGAEATRQVCAWGGSRSAQLGLVSALGRPYPVPVSGVSGASKVAPTGQT